MSSIDATTTATSTFSSPSESTTDTRWRTSPTGPIKDLTAATYFNFMLLFIFMFFVLAGLPKTLPHIRAGPTGGWKQGWLLKKSVLGQSKPTYARHATQDSYSNPPSRNVSSKSARSNRSKFSDVNLKGGGPNDVPVMDIDYIIPTLKNAPGGSPQLYGTPPGHIPSWSTLFYPLSNYISKTAYGYSYGRVGIYAGYTVLFFICLLYHSNPTVNFRRSGWLVVSQFPLILLLASKNSIVGTMLGVGYEKLNHLHRWVGKFMFIASLFHVVGYLVIWTKRGTLTENSVSEAPGWVAFGGLCFLACLSIPSMRRGAYTIFIYSHHLGYIIMFVALCFHVPTLIPWSLAAGFLLGLDHFIRFLKTHIIPAQIYAVPELGCTRIEIPWVTKGWRAGQHVRIRAVSHKMGFFTCFEAHPFTIASVAELPNYGGGQGIVLYCKKAGNWTNRLYDIAGDSHPELGSEKAKKGAMAMGMGNTMKLIVEGPYGGPGLTMLSGYSAALIVVGGSGITFGLSTAEELIRDAECNSGRTRLIQLVWVVQDHSSLIPLQEHLSQLIKRAARLPSLRMKIGIHYTQASKLMPMTNRIGPNGQLLRNASTTSSEERRLTVEYDLPYGMHLRAGRPKMSTILEALIEKTSSLRAVISDKDADLNLVGAVQKPTGIVVAACGPLGLAADAKTTVMGVSREARSSVGGVEFFEETFGW